MIHLVEIIEFPTESLSDRLMTQTNTQDGLFSRIPLDQWEQQARFRWDTRPRREDDPVEFRNLVQRNLIIAEHFRCGSQDLRHEVHEVVGERIVIVENKYAGHVSDFNWID